MAFFEDTTIPDLRYLADTYFGVVLAGQFGLTVLVATFIFSKNIYRHPTLVNFCATWIVYAIIYSLTLYPGQRAYPESDNPSILCSTQSYFVHGAAPMGATAGCLLLINILYKIQHPTTTLMNKFHPILRHCLSILPPYVILFGLSFGASRVAAMNPGSISRKNGLYCTIYHEPFRRLMTPIVSGVLMVVIVILETMILWHTFRKISHMKKIFPLRQVRASRSLIIRIAIFTAYSVLSLAVCALFIMSQYIAVAYMAPIFLPLVAFILFGSQTEIMATWFGRLFPSVFDTRFDSNMPTVGSMNSRTPLGEHAPECSFRHSESSPYNPGAPLPPLPDIV